MIGLEGQLAVVDSLIEALDTAQQDLRTMKIYKIEHVGAEEVKKKLQELGIIGGTAETPSRITGPRPPTAETAGQPPTPGMARTTSTTGAVTEALVEQPQVIVIEPTNSLLINATAEQHIQITGIIKYVDSETEKDTIPYVIYPLENQKPEDLAEILNKLIQETIKDKEGKIQQVVKKTEEEIIIVPDKNTFSIIVYANQKNQKWIANLIETLDKRRPQVLIDVTLVEISEVDKFTYDLQLISKFPAMTPGGSMQKLGGKDVLPLIEPFPSNTVREATSILGEGGSGKGFYADRHIQALLQLMSEKGYGRVLAKPKILVNDNEKGHIDTTNTIYVSRSASTVATNVTGGGTPISTSYTFDTFPSGIQLDITPHISEGSLLRLELKMQRSSQVPPAQIVENTPPPNKTENNLETVVTVPDNSTIILGGILTLEQGKKNWKVPLLGDVPIVGGLFRKIDDSSTQTKLYVFVKANILRPGKEEKGLSDIKVISEKNRAAFEKSETAIHTYEALPGIKPQPMNPLHVLDTE
jgi:general secretion pathway protein D